MKNPKRNSDLLIVETVPTGQTKAPTVPPFNLWNNFSRFIFPLLHLGVKR